MARMTIGWVTASQSPGLSKAASQAARRWHSAANDSPPCTALAGSRSHSANACGCSACSCFNDKPCQRPRSQSAKPGSTCTAPVNHAAVSQARRSGALSSCTPDRSASACRASGRMPSSVWCRRPFFWAWVRAWQIRVRRMAFTRHFSQRAGVHGLARCETFGCNNVAGHSRPD